jgi:5-hydroxyisourate hydrolase
MSPITSHVLDTMSGKPAAGLAVVLEIALKPDRWSVVGRAVTDAGGRVTGFDPPIQSLCRQSYRLRFATGAYFAATCARFILRFTSSSWSTTPQRTTTFPCS